MVTLSTVFVVVEKKALAERQSSPQELEVSPRSGVYLLVYIRVKENYLCDILVVLYQPEAMT